jgi:hypothetical protein
MWELLLPFPIYPMSALEVSGVRNVSFEADEWWSEGTFEGAG